ncbi:ricin-type beta-trefoil lectin domain protein [Dactylosporangium sp. NPDC000244]|uniref:ricin-type beta-trefoil lectin domain protein n=1 Tax=Dactylosporangium sp. NPDC000244 TaxID=3154365 RepID=UPI003333399B
MPQSEESFAAAYARKPATAARGLLPDRRVWIAAGGLATLAVLVVVPLQLRWPSPDRPQVADPQYAFPAAVTESQASPSVAPGSPAPSAAPVKSAAGQPAATTQQPKSTGGTPAKAAPTNTAGAAGVKPPAVATTAAAPTIPGRAIVGVQSGLCLSANSGKDGAALTIARCDGSAVQHWETAPDGTIRSVGLCMDAAWASTDDYTTIQVAKCNGNQAQQWRLNGSNDLVDTQANKCADVFGENTAPGSAVKLWPCNGKSNQKWYWR